jgi:hypothetical protein
MLNARIQLNPSPRAWRLRGILLNKRILPASECLVHRTAPFSLDYYSNPLPSAFRSRMWT